MKTLISIDNIRTYRPIAKTIDVDRLTMYISESQINDLKPVLGEQLFCDLINKFDVVGDTMFTAYSELLNGKSYTPVGYIGAINYEGIIPMLSYYVLARFFRNNPVNATRFGIVQKQNENFSSPVTPVELTMAVDSMLSMALSYQESVIDFLKNNQTVYTLSKYVDTTKIINSTGVKFFSL